MSAKTGKRRIRTAHEKLVAIRRVHDGERKASVARDIGVAESTLRGWCKNVEKISYISPQSSPETDDSVHGTTNYHPVKEKKRKIDESPYYLSLKPTTIQQRLSCSPGAADNLEDAKPKTQYQNGNKVSAVLDNLLLINNNSNTIASGHDVDEGGKEDESESQSEALEHGEKFLKWLECCSEPSVTVMQILKLRGLVNNIKKGVSRQENGHQQET